MEGRLLRRARARLRIGLTGLAVWAAVTGAATLPALSAPIDWSTAKGHWSFRAPQPQRLPVVKRKDWPAQRLDHFILARLEQARLAPSVQAEPRTLIRRATLDLTGLPPTPDEVESFLAEWDAKRRGARATGGRSAAGSAYRRLIERLLSAPSFGERMASMWLPLARYAEDQAHQVGSDTKFFYPNAHLYRQWVVDAFNRDLPYDQFVRRQIAADVDPSRSRGDLAALGFIGLGPKYYNRNRLDVMADEWQDRVDTVTRTFLGLTVACARCHDHKYDPITTEDYYALAGVFASTKMVNKSPDGALDEASDAAKMRKDTVHVVEDAPVRDLNVFIRGNTENKGPVVPRRFLRVLSEGEPAVFHDGSGRRELAESIASSRNPLTARVMVNRIWAAFFGAPLVGTPSNFGLIGDRPTHPELLDDLAVRFVKNGWSVKSLVREIVLSAAYRQRSDCGLRIADRGLVRAAGHSVSPAGNGGSAGRPDSKGGPPGIGRPAPTGVTGSPNPQSAIRNPQSVDPTNRLLWRMNRRRLTVEQWRDAVLSATGTLERGGGPSMDLLEPANHRRTLYAAVSRLKLNDLLMQFDYPDANVHAEKRAVTTTPIQKLFLLNSPFMLEQARALAAKVTAGPVLPEEERVRRAYLLLYGRRPTGEELRLGVGYLRKPEAEGMPRWERYAQVLLASNELLYVD
jgi:hypothetical protein